MKLSIPMSFLDIISMIEKAENGFSVFNSAYHDEQGGVCDNQIQIGFG